jgi:hypothetical protein
VLAVMAGRHQPARSHLDNSVSFSPLTLKCDLNAESPEKCLQPAQLASERARVFWPIRDTPREAVPPDDTRIEKVRCRAFPPLLFCHYSAYAGRYRIGFNSTFDCPASIGADAVSRAVAHFAKSAMRGKRTN